MKKQNFQEYKRPGNSSIENGRLENSTGFELAFSRVNSSSNKQV